MGVRADERGGAHHGDFTVRPQVARRAGKFASEENVDQCDVSGIPEPRSELSLHVAEDWRVADIAVLEFRTTKPEVVPVAIAVAIGEEVTP